MQCYNIDTSFICNMIAICITCNSNLQTWDSHFPCPEFQAAGWDTRTSIAENFKARNEDAKNIPNMWNWPHETTQCLSIYQYNAIYLFAIGPGRIIP